MAKDRNQSSRRAVDAVVYTMGKVGSSTVSTSLKAAGLNCLDIHFLAPDRIVTALEAHMNNDDLREIPRHFVDSIHAYNAVRKQERVKLITLVREPVARNISAVFQNLPKKLEGDEAAILERLANYPTRSPDFWFENDFIPTSGVDVFADEVAADLDREADHFRFERGNLDVLVLKLEADDARKSEILSDFLGARIALERANEAARKWYYNAYKSIVADPGAIRARFVEDCAALKYFKVFYSEREREEARQRYAVG